MRALRGFKYLAYTHNCCRPLFSARAHIKWGNIYFVRKVKKKKNVSPLSIYSLYLYRYDTSKDISRWQGSFYVELFYICERGKVICETPFYLSTVVEKCCQFCCAHKKKSHRIGNSIAHIEMDIYWSRTNVTRSNAFMHIYRSILCGLSRIYTRYMGRRRRDDDVDEAKIFNWTCGECARASKLDLL